MDQEGLLFPKSGTKKKRKKHMKSILPGDQPGICYLCGSRQRIEDHHIFFGTGSRTKSEETMQTLLYDMQVLGHVCKG